MQTISFHPRDVISVPSRRLNLIWPGRVIEPYEDH